MKLKLILILVGAVIGFCAGRCVSVCGASGEPKQAEQSSGNSAELAKARREIAVLERELSAMRKSAAVSAAATTADDAGPSQESAEPGENGETNYVVAVGEDVDVIGEMKKRLDEEDFGKVTNAMARLKANMAAKAKDRIAFRKSIDVSAMTKEERDEHSKFIELAERREAVMAKMKFGIPDQSTLQEMMEVEMLIRPAAKEERSALSLELAHELGYSGEDAESVRDAIVNIFDSTSGGLDGMMDAAGIIPLFELDAYATPVEMMAAVPGDTLDPAVEAKYRKALGYSGTVERMERFAFYERAKKAYAVVISGETAKYGNIILKKGVTPIEMEVRT